MVQLDLALELDQEQDQERDRVQAQAMAVKMDRLTTRDSQTYLSDIDIDMILLLQV